MRAIFCLLLSLAVVFPALADPLDRGAARDLARGGDPDAIEAAFAAHQAAFNEGEIGPGVYRSPYWAFATTEPKVEATLEGWLDAYPESPQAAAARSFQLSHVAYLVRGGESASKTPDAAMERFRTLASEALGLARQALDAEPRHLAAAHRLMNIAAFLGARADRDRAFRAVEELDTPASTLLSGLRFNFQRWGGSPEATRRYCEERAPLVPDISVEECLALADYEQRDLYPNRVGEAIAILAKGSEAHFLEQHVAALSAGGQPEAAYELARSRGFMTYEFAYALANALGDMSYVEDLAARNLRDDPLSPVDLVVQATTLARSGEIEAARKAMEDAMIHGVHNPTVRRMRLQTMFQHRELGADMVAEMVDAIEATGDDMEILGQALHFLIISSDHVSHLPDGTPRPDFECHRLKILERHKRACDAGSGHHSCRPGLASYRDNFILEAKATEACGEATGTTWQDVVRYLLDLTE